MPSHWTYEKKTPEGDLYQGDIIIRAEPLLAVLGSVHSYFCDEKYLGFTVTSQTCDLVLRKGKCKAKYINLAVIRSLESMLPTLFGDGCKTAIDGVYYKDGRAEIRELIERIINQNEDVLGLFYLEPDGDLELAVPSAALLRVSFALGVEHYETIKNARRGRLGAQFRNKLGWLTGNLYSRVDTPDWPETVGKEDADTKIDKIFDDIDEASENIWVQRKLLDIALNKDASIKALPKDQIINAINRHAPQAPHVEALLRVRELAPPLLELVAQPDLKATVEQLKTNRAYCRLTADAIADGLRPYIEGAKLFDLTTRLTEDRRLYEGASSAMDTLTNDFFRMRGLKSYDAFLGMYMQRPLLHALTHEAVIEHARATSVEAELEPTILQVLQDRTPNDALRDCILLVVQASAARNLAGRLASSLTRDAAFVGAFSGS